MDRISVQGAVDMHCHSTPCIFPRSMDDWEVADAAQAAGMDALVLKCHHESSVSRAYLIGQHHSNLNNLKVFGGIVLNSFVGGINPAAVEAALRMGGKVVWMPSVDAAHHAHAYGITGGYDRQSSNVGSGYAGITIVDQGRLTRETHEVIELVAQHDAILGTSHLSPQEIRILVAEARKSGVERILIMHPLFKVPRLPMDVIEEIVGLGAILEIDYCGMSPMWAEVRLEDLVHLVKTFGAEHCILVSDGGQTHNPAPCDALRLLAQNLFESGIGEEQLHTMMNATPKQLLGI